MWKLLAAVALLLPSVASTQVITSYRTDKTAEIKGDPERIVCKKEETIGTRLGSKKVCLTVADWNALARENRERTEQIQAGTCQTGEGQGCLNPF
jgi:hypothetical protein